MPDSDCTQQICSKHKRICLDLLDDDDDEDYTLELPSPSSPLLSATCPLVPLSSSNEQSPSEIPSPTFSNYMCIKCYFELSRQTFLSRIASEQQQKQIEQNRINQSRQLQLQQHQKQRNLTRNIVSFANDFTPSDLVLIQKHLLAVRHGGDTLDVIDLKGETCISSHKSSEIFGGVTQMCSMSVDRGGSHCILLLSPIENNGFASVYDYRKRSVVSRITLRVTLARQLTARVTVVIHHEEVEAIEGIRGFVQRISMYDACSSKRELRRFPQRLRGIRSFDISSNREKIACASYELMVILILSMQSGEVIRRIATDSIVTKIFFEPSSLNLLFETCEFALCYFDYARQKISKTRYAKFFEFMHGSQTIEKGTNHHKLMFCKKFVSARSLRNEAALSIYDFTKQKTSHFGSQLLNPLPKVIHGVLSYMQSKIIFISKNNIVFCH